MSMSSEMALENAGGTQSVPVWAHVVPETVSEVSDAIRRSAGLLSVSGGRYSPDTQFAQPGALHIDLSRLDNVVKLEMLGMRVTVQAGIRWFDLLRFLQPHGLSVRVVPAFANFTVGGSIASNQTSPHLRCGPVAEGVTALTLVMADGSVRSVRPEVDGDLFRAVVGGFGGCGVIVEAEIELVPNTPLLRRSHAMTADLYPDFFRSRIQADAGARIHSADFEAPTFDRLRAVTWVETQSTPTHQQPLHYPGMVDPLRRVLDWSRPATALGRFYRHSIIEPLAAARKTIHWRNYEASHDLQAFDPKIHERPLYAFHDFTVPLARFGDFQTAVRRIVARYHVPAVRLTVTHYGPGTRSYLAPVDGDAAFHCRLVTRSQVKLRRGSHHDPDVWARELVQAAIDCGGQFDPAFRMVATRDQFEQAFPSSLRLIRIKREVDPLDRFGNGFWRHFYDIPSSDPVTVFLPEAGGVESAPPALWRPPVSPRPQTASPHAPVAMAAAHAADPVPARESSSGPGRGHPFLEAAAAPGVAAEAASAAAAPAVAANGANGTNAANGAHGAGHGGSPVPGAADPAKARARRNRVAAVPEARLPQSEFAMAWSQPVPRDNLYRMLRDLAPGKKAPHIFKLLAQQVERNDSDELIYRNLRRSLMKWHQSWHASVSMRPVDWTAPLARRLLAFTSERLRAHRQDDHGRIDGLAEIGSEGLIGSALRPHYRLIGPHVLLDVAGRPQGGDGGATRRASGLGRLLGSQSKRAGRSEEAAFGLPARQLAPDADDEGMSPFGAEESLDLITVYAGLRGFGDEALRTLLDDMMDALRPGGLILVLDHDADGAHDALEASVALRLAALCDLQTWEQSEFWPREFRSAEDWVLEFADAGFEEVGARERVARSPWGNLLTAFQKPADPSI